MRANKQMSRKKSEEPGKTFQVRLNPKETARYWRLWEFAQVKTSGAIKEADFNRLLLGLKENLRIITEKEREFFLGRIEEVKLLGQMKAGKPHIRKVASPKDGRK